MEGSSALAVAVALWAVGIIALEARTPIAHAFSPAASGKALLGLLGSGELWPHVVASLKRVALGILFAVLLGVPAGLALGMSHGIRQAVTPLFQLLRMISPLSWMPLAVMTLGIGDAPVVSCLSSPQSGRSCSTLPRVLLRWIRTGCDWPRA